MVAIGNSGKRSLARCLDWRSTKAEARSKSLGFTSARLFHGIIMDALAGLSRSSGGTVGFKSFHTSDFIEKLPEFGDFREFLVGKSQPAFQFFIKLSFVSQIWKYNPKCRVNFSIRPTHIEGMRKSCQYCGLLGMECHPCYQWLQKIVTALKNLPKVGQIQTKLNVAFVWSFFLASTHPAHRSRSSV